MQYTEFVHPEDAAALKALKSIPMLSTIVKKVMDVGAEQLQTGRWRNAHKIWAKARTDQGWTYGPERNEQKKETPDMLPYCNLPESEKLYDREMAMQTLKLVKKLGFEIKKRK